MWHKFSARSPFRPADWRFQRALLAANGTLPLSRKRDDAWTIRATKFLRALNQCSDEFDQWHLEETDPDIFWARTVYLASEDVARPVRYTIEALILAGAPFADIAKRSGVELGVIEAFEAVFFAVNDAIQNGHVDWILNQAIGPAIRRGLNAREYDLLWKLIALKGGPFAVYRMLEVYDAPAAPTERSAADNYLHDVFRSWLTSNAVLAQATMQINGFTQLDLTKEYREWCTVEKAQGRGAGTEATVFTGLAHALGQFQIMVGPDKEAKNPKLALADQRAAEPRYAEVLALSGGQDYEVDPELLTLTFPEPGGK